MAAPVLAAKALSNPKTVKTIVIIVIVIIVLFIAYTQYKKWQKTKKSKEFTSQADKEIVAETQTFSESDYKAMADKLEQAMKGLGTDNDAVLQVLASLKTKSDWLSLVSAFGIRESGVWPGNFSGNLIEWLSDELGGGARQRVNFVLQKFGVQV